MDPTKKTGQRTITGTLECLSGMRIGGSDDLLQIGGTDLTCIKHPVTLKPYIPGTSIKGKMRSELEKRDGKFGGQRGDEPCGCAQDTCLVCRVFGPHKRAQHTLGPSRIIVRDAQLLSGGELETKSENVINRKTGTAEHPRKVERVASGATFSIKIGIQIWDCDKADDLVNFVKEGLRQIQSTGIGSGVSKGSGEVVFKDLKLDGTPFDL